MNYIKQTLYSLLMLVVLCNCNKDDGREQEGTNLTNDAKLEIVEGNDQTGYLGDKLSSKIVVKASADVARRFLLSFEVIKGEGKIDVVDYFGRTNGMYALDPKDQLGFNWHLGCKDAEQKVKITLYTDSIKSNDGSYIYHTRPSFELIVSATAAKPKGWARACGCGSLDTYFSRIVSFDDKTFYLIDRANGGILYSVDKGVNWEKPNFIPNSEDVYSITFNSKGWAYVTTKNQGVLFSKDMINWTTINNGLLNYWEPTSFYVDDEILMASFYSGGIYISTNNGAFWRKLLAGDPPNHFISRHPNGDLYFWDKWSDCYRSNDLGKTWIKLDINYEYVDYEITDFKIDKSGFLYIGSGDATISVIDPSTLEGEVHRYYEWNSVHQTISNITITNDDVLYTVNGHPKKGLYSKKNNWQYLDLNFPYTVLNYYLKPDNTYIILSEDGVFYFSN